MSSHSPYAYIGWREGNGGPVPVARAFDDPYFSLDGALGESRHVFIDGIGGAAFLKDRPHLAIGEAGFGTGLNFLATWQAWRDLAPPDAQLDYVAVEGFLLSRTDAARALDPFAEIAGPAAALLDTWPAPLPGAHRLLFDGGRVRLTLLIDEIGAALHGYDGTLDAWYLDGFAPARNPDMWRPEVLAAVARCSKPGARLASYTAAGAVRRGLDEAGFTVERRPGFGRKRHCLAAVLDRSPAPVAHAWPGVAPPVAAGARVAVIGAGIAGCAAAAALVRHGFETIIVDRHPAPAGEASGNPIGLVKPRLIAGAGPQSRFLASAYLHAVALYDRLAADGAPVWHPARGALTGARDAAEEEKFARLATALPWPEDSLRAVDREEAARLTGLPVAFGGIWFPGAGAVFPPALCQGLAAGIPFIGGREVARLTHTAAGWVLHAEDGATIAAADAVVLAGGAFAATLCGDGAVPVGANRGQLTLLDAGSAEVPASALACGAYAAPPFESARGRLVATGATYDRWHNISDREWSRVRPADHLRTLSRLATAFGGWDLADEARIAGGRASLRATTLDRLPAAGPVPDAQRFAAAGAPLRHGRMPSALPADAWRPGLWMLSGLGSHGLQTAPLAAEVVASAMAGHPPPLDAATMAALSPARFLAWRLRRGRGVGTRS